ncbi:hypothetical protein LVJ94_49810 [Pendulispora rubella]|uniref:Uncharacterized protein n=1 Tax=Pendulispora rubella TaxID=2741070 RepID=A0ABZ2L4T5_9BACT
MKSTFVATFLVLSAIGVGACSSSSTPSDAPPANDAKPVTITAHTPTLIEGTFVDSSTSLSFKSVEYETKKVEVTIRAGETNLVVHIDYAQGEGDFDANSGQLDQAQINAMPRLLEGLAAAIPDYGPVSLEGLARTVNFLSVAPSSTPLPAFKSVAENGWAYLSCGCRWQDAHGYHNWMGKGESCGSSASPHCPGRCGVGCGPDNLWFAWGSGTYTADCARHDYGVGSWGSAFDDYTFAPHNCL